MADVLNNIETFRKADELMRICRSAVRKAQAESRRLGVAMFTRSTANDTSNFPTATIRGAVRSRPAAIMNSMPMHWNG